MDELRKLLADLIEDHWIKVLTGLVLLALGRWWGGVRARKEWDRKEFMNRLMVSLNTIHHDSEGKPMLAIRTLLEKDITDVLLNSVAVKKVLAKAAETTESNPLLPLEPDDRWFLLNAILNEVAERFAEGTLARDQGVAVSSHRYLICLTSEVAGAARTRKIRAMVVRKDLLTGGAFEQGLALEHPRHETRLATLRTMRETYERTPDLFLDLELIIPLGYAA